MAVLVARAIKLPTTVLKFTEPCLSKRKNNVHFTRVEGFEQGSAIEGPTTVSKSAEIGLSQYWAIEQRVGCPYRFNEKKANV